MAKRFEMVTTRGYDFYAVSSTIQKAIRRGDGRTAGYFAIELAESGYTDYLWYRLLVISAEDCWGIITQEIDALFNSYQLGVKRGKNPRVFIAKAVLILAEAKKCRDADHLTNFIYDDQIGGFDDIMKEYEKELHEPIPDYAYDVHTKIGKMRGKTKPMFFEEEFNSLTPRQVGLFDNLIK
jgi:replication-associated recombination protein RarA